MHPKQLLSEAPTMAGLATRQSRQTLGGPLGSCFTSWQLFVVISLFSDLLVKGPENICSLSTADGWAQVMS